MALCACPLEGQTPHRPTATDQPASHPASAATAAPSAKQLNGAEAHFTAILASKPQDASALSGMGLVRLQQRNYLGAISYLEQARKTQPQNKTLADALDTARFRFFLGEGDHSLASNELTAAERRYLSALELRPDSPEAFAGLHTTLVKARRAQRLSPAPLPAQPAPAPAQRIPAPAFAARTPAAAPQPAPPPVDMAVAANITVAAPPTQSAATQQPAPPNAIAAPRPVQPASDSTSKEEVYGPFVPYVRPTPPQTKMAAIPSTGH